MKGLVLIFAFLVASSNALDKELVDQFVEMVKSVAEDCKTEVGASEADMQELVERKIPSSHEGKCVIFCTQKYFKILSEDGKYQEDEAVANLAPLKDLDEEIYNKSVTLVKTCSKVKADADPCITATLVAACGVTEGKKLGLERIFS